MNCPRCELPLRAAIEPTSKGRVELDYCPRCNGVWFDARELPQLLDIANLDAFTRNSPLLSEGEPSGLYCPRHAHSPMRERELLARPQAESDLLGRPLHIDQCMGCEGIWLDGQELKEVAAAMREKRVQPFLEDQQARRPTGAALWLFMFFTGLPIEPFHPRWRRPLVTGTIIALCFLGFVLEAFASSAEQLLRFALVPAQFQASPLSLSLITYMFLHGGLAHLLGNLYFLWIFGDNVEDRLGHGRYLALYLVSGIAAGVVHCLLTTDLTVPVVGASGAISGVMAGYAVIFPRARLVSLILFWQVRWRSSTYLLIWLAIQFMGVAFGAPGIAWWAHIGGFAAGALLTWRFRG